MKSLLIVVFTVIISPAAFAEKKPTVAVAKIIRGQVHVLTMGKTIELKANQEVEDGAVIKTEDKSFAKLVFIDQSQMNVGPNSEMKIEKFSKNEAGVIDLVKGKIRSQVTKDYLQMDKSESKLFIKTPNAVMGIRGTDFMISYNGANTSAVLFEGEVVFNNHAADRASPNLEAVVNQGVRMHPGEFSVVEQTRPTPTLPAKLNVHQLETLQKNANFEPDRSPSNSAKVESKSIVPKGLNGAVVSNESSVIKAEAPAKPTSATAEGFVSGDKVKPTNGSFLHVDSGVIIPPGPDSILDPNTNTYIPSPDTGTVASDGNFVPPKNVEITNDGKILVTVTNSDGQVKKVEVPKPAPVLGSTPLVSYTKPSPVVPSALPSRKSDFDAKFNANPNSPRENFGAAPVPTGGVNVTTPPAQRSFSDVTIRVNKN